ncbi:cardiolipin synthase [Sphingobacterium sp. DK4209]|uniref:Cardiolipin synthase n=1 Tax=Sphingobacterium zhuxiongii TaxID=2662364 RepID=A0A5Q0QC86_9SPHI|nr:MULTISPECIES: cardiolipin synthase [unclassified Sphingobacterium]MVZ67531.1 cardiolipin synthase [Sphingobacterium sp. DK4209]QGA27183.1 cardiolipin synthase [Sphingobacterium sp. dk4302]
MNEYIQPVILFLEQWGWMPSSIIYLGVIITILIENRNPTKTISWVMVIVFLPLVGVILYYLFGQKFSKVKKLKRLNQEQTLRLKKEFQRLEPLMTWSIQNIHNKIGDFARVYSYLKNERLSSPTLNNEVTLLVNGEEKFKYFLESLESASHSIHLEYYIFDLDQIGTKVLNILEQKASEGVKVRLIVDSFGSPQLVRHMRKIKNETKIEFQAFLPVTFTSLANSNYRNHRKIAVIDGYTAYIGGINISDRYSNPNNFGLYWRDTSVKVVGNAGTMFQISFWNSWNQTDGESFNLEDGYLKDMPVVAEQLSAVALVSSDPGSMGPFNMEALLLAIGEANESIKLWTPYFIPSEELSTALKTAAAAGVNVELMIPATGDSWIVQHASFSFLKPLLERGVKVYLYEKGFLHAKTSVIDKKIAYVGTVNLDFRSFYINYEVAAAISNKRFCEQLDEQFEIDKQDSRIVTLKDWKKRKAWKRGIDSLCRLLAPLL